MVSTLARATIQKQDWVAVNEIIAGLAQLLHVEKSYGHRNSSARFTQGGRSVQAESRDSSFSFQRHFVICDGPV